MKIVYGNIINNGEITSITNESANKPFSYALHPYLEKFFECTDNNTDITIEFNEPQEANCFIYGNHNLKLGLIVFKNEFGAIIKNQILPLAQVYTGNRLFSFSLVTGIYKIELYLESNDPIFYAGSIFISKYLEMPRFNQSPTFSISLRSSSFESGSGQSSGNASVNLDNFPFSWTDIDYAKMNEIKEYLEFVQTSKPHWIDPYPDLQESYPQPDEKSLKFPIQYVKISESDIPQPKRRIRNWKYDLNITYRKAK